MVAVSFAACSDDDPVVDATPEPTELSVTAADWQFPGAPTTVDVEGLVTLTVKNDGTEPHEAALIKIEQGKTIDDVRAALSPGAPPGPPPFTLAGGTTGTAPGTSATITQALPAGEYAFICFIESPDGTPHFAQGMLAPLTVTGTSTDSLPLPDGENAVMKDFTYELPDLEAGETTIRVTNEGEQDHVMGYAKMADGKTADDALAWLKAPQGPPPFTALGGPAAGPGGRNSFVVDLSAGTYVFYCPVPDVTDPDMTPHFNKGMFTGVTIS